MQQEGHCYVITGGTQGLGLAVARQLLDSPVDAIITDPDKFPRPHVRAVLSNQADLKPVEKQLFTCETCHMNVVGQNVWETHVNGRKHKSAVARAKRARPLLSLSKEEEEST